MNFRINLMWFLAMIVVVGISNATLFYDFEGGGPGFTLNGDAVVDSGSVRLTRNVGSLLGSVIFDQISTDPVADFVVSFDFRMTSGADGMSFALMDAGVHGSTETWSETGPGAGSLSVCFDIYDNGAPADQGGNFVEIRLDDVSVEIAIPSFTMESSQWHHADISFDGSNLTLVLTPEGGTEEILFDAVAVPGFTPFVGRYGFSARTGGVSSEQRIDNVRIGRRDKAYNPSPADGEWFRYYTDVTELAWTLPPPISDSNQPEIVTCDVLWFGTNPGGTPELLVDNAAVEFVSLGLRADAPAYYYWRVDTYDPNGGFLTKTEGDLWTFSSARDIPMVFVDESGPAGEESTDVSEELPIPSRDDYLLSLSSDPGSDTVTITVSEVPKPLTNTKETMESYNGETDAVELRVAHSGGAEVLYSVINGDDDGEENDDDGANPGNVDLGSSDLEFFDDAGDGGLNQVIGLRFQNVTIAKDAIIDSAFVDFERDEAEASGEVHGFITGEAIGNAPAFVGGAASFDFTTRLAANPTTTVPFLWAEDYGGSEIVPTSDIASIIQEIVNGDDWVSGNSIVLFFTKNTDDHPFDLEFIDTTTLAVLGQGSWDYVLDSSNWEGVTVTIAAIDDDLFEGIDPEMITLEHQVAGTGVWAGVQADSVEVSIIENDCGAWSFEVHDFNQDCVVDLGDLVELVNAWLTCTRPNIPGSGCVDTR